MKNLTHYMSVRDFAAKVGISVQAVHKAVKAGRIKDFQRVGYVFLVNRAEVKRFGAPKR